MSYGKDESMNGKEWDEIAKELGLETGDSSLFDDSRIAQTIHVNSELLKTINPGAGVIMLGPEPVVAPDNAQYVDDTVVTWETQDDRGNWIKHYGRFDDEGNVVPMLDG